MAGTTFMNIGIVPGTGMIMGEDLFMTVVDELKAHSDEISDLILESVQIKTPIETGALLTDLTYSSAQSPGSYKLGEFDITYVYAEGIEQQAFWDRIYVPYVEGGPLGLPTYTNDPRLIFLETSIEAIPEIEAWASLWAQSAMAKAAVGEGTPLP